MEIVIFKDKKWHEIQRQDNPAFDYIYNDSRLQERIVGRNNHCLVICKAEDYQSTSISNGYVVVEIPYEPKDVIKRGLFWHLEYAELFAEALAEKK